ncbi:MAG: DUF3870 domain-containing protein [Firmicutes bacterium]|nr:DUF3870 domain-containing protein [Bacillota bacterium]
MNTYYFVGDAQVASNNPIYQQYGAFFIGLEIDVSGNIIEASCNAILPLTRRFIRRLLIGRNINDIEDICADVEKYYHGSSQRTVVVALKDAHKKYHNKLVD